MTVKEICFYLVVSVIGIILIVNIYFFITKEDQNLKSSAMKMIAERPESSSNRSSNKVNSKRKLTSTNLRVEANSKGTFDGHFENGNLLKGLFFEQNGKRVIKEQNKSVSFDNFDGTGLIKFKDGSKYNGKFKNGTKIGIGVFKDNSTSSRLESHFLRDELDGSGNHTSFNITMNSKN
jgi:hypothetical protein